MVTFDPVYGNYYNAGPNGMKYYTGPPGVYNSSGQLVNAPQVNTTQINANTGQSVNSAAAQSTQTQKQNALQQLNGAGGGLGGSSATTLTPAQIANLQHSLAATSAAQAGSSYQTSTGGGNPSVPPPPKSHGPTFTPPPAIPAPLPSFSPGATANYISQNGLESSLKNALVNGTPRNTEFSSNRLTNPIGNTSGIRNSGPSPMSSFGVGGFGGRLGM